MAIKTLFTKKRALRWVAACVASVVTTFVGVYPEPFAMTPGEQRCSLRDVSAWQIALNDPDQEITAEYRLGVTEAFLAHCPNRPERAEAHQVAGLAAMYAGLTERALKHFEQAEPIYDTDILFAYAAILLQTGETDLAWHNRDRLIARWKTIAERRLAAPIEAMQVAGGTIYILDRGQYGTDLTHAHAWIAIPDGPGWPATLSVGTDRQLSAFRKLRAPEVQANMTVIDLYRCRGRRILARLDTAPAPSDLHATAIAAMTAYLAQPDTDADGTCLWPHRLLPKPQR